MSEVMSAEDAKIDVRNTASRKSPIESRKLCQRSQNLCHLSVVAQGGGECCREVLENNVVEKCCRGCCSEVLGRQVLLRVLFSDANFVQDICLPFCTQDKKAVAYKYT